MATSAQSEESTTLGPIVIKVNRSKRLGKDADVLDCFKDSFSSRAQEFEQKCKALYQNFNAMVTKTERNKLRILRLRKELCKQRNIRRHICNRLSFYNDNYMDAYIEVKDSNHVSSKVEQLIGEVLTNTEVAAKRRKIEVKKPPKKDVMVIEKPPPDANETINRILTQASTEIQKKEQAKKVVVNSSISMPGVVLSTSQKDVSGLNRHDPNAPLSSSDAVSTEGRVTYSISTSGVATYLPPKASMKPGPPADIFASRPIAGAQTILTASSGKPMVYFDSSSGIPIQSISVSTTTAEAPCKPRSPVFAKPFPPSRTSTGNSSKSIIKPPNVTTSSSSHDHSHPSSQALKTNHVARKPLNAPTITTSASSSPNQKLRAVPVQRTQNYQPLPKPARPDEHEKDHSKSSKTAAKASKGGSYAVISHHDIGPLKGSVLQNALSSQPTPISSAGGSHQQHSRQTIQIIRPVDNVFMTPNNPEIIQFDPSKATTLMVDAKGQIIIPKDHARSPAPLPLPINNQKTTPSKKSTAYKKEEQERAKLLQMEVEQEVRKEQQQQQQVVYPHRMPPHQPSPLVLQSVSQPKLREALQKAGGHLTQISQAPQFLPSFALADLSGNIVQKDQHPQIMYIDGSQCIQIAGQPGMSFAVAPQTVRFVVPQNAPQPMQPIPQQATIITTPVKPQQPPPGDREFDRLLRASSIDHLLPEGPDSDPPPTAPPRQPGTTSSSSFDDNIDWSKVDEPKKRKRSSSNRKRASTNASDINNDAMAKISPILAQFQQELAQSAIAQEQHQQQQLTLAARNALKTSPAKSKKRASKAERERITTERLNAAINMASTSSSGSSTLSDKQLPLPARSSLSISPQSTNSEQSISPSSAGQRTCSLPPLTIRPQTAPSFSLPPHRAAGASVSVAAALPLIPPHSS